MDMVQLTADFQAAKQVLVDSSGLAKDTLHVYFGLALFVAVRLVWRRRFGWLIAWGVTLMMALGVEWFDMRAEALRSDIQPDAAHWHDVWNTMFWPTVLALVGRWLEPTGPASADLPDERA
jgi:hypothetical protein